MGIRVSVIIPVHDSAAYLAACLDSVTVQTEISMEIWTVDDASTDVSLQMLYDYEEKDHRIHVLSLPNQQGVNAARNAALEKAKGRYIVFCDSDDTVPPNAYKRLADTADRGQYDIVIGAHEDRNDDGFTVRRSIRRNKGDIDTFMQTSTVWERIWRRDFIEENRLFFPDYLTGGDAVFISYAYRCHPKTGYIDDCVYQYWAHNRAATPSIVNTYKCAYFQERLRCCEELLKVLGECDLQAAQRYIYVDQLPYLRGKFLRILDGKEAEPAFSAFKNFLQKCDWSEYPGVFESEFMMALEEMLPLSALEYHLRYHGNACGVLDARDEVLVEFRQGKIGLQYVIRYLGAWLKHKLGSS